MGILDAIQGKRIYLDTNIWIYALEGYPAFFQDLTQLFQSIDRINIKLPDAIHAATAILTQCSTFLTNDQRFGSVSELSVILLSQINSR